MAQVNLMIGEDKKSYIREAVDQFGHRTSVIFSKSDIADKAYAHISAASVEDACRVCYLAGYFQASELIRSTK